MAFISRFRSAAAVFAAALPAALFCLCGGRRMLAAAGAVALHECAHLVFLRLCGGRLRGFSAAPFGFCLSFDPESLSLWGEAAVCAAGSAANLLLAVLLCAAGQGGEVCLVHLLLGLLNLLPMRPLDGGRLLTLAASALFGADAGERCGQTVSALLSFFFFLCAAYLLLCGVGGFYLLLFSLYTLTRTFPDICERKRRKTENFGGKRRIQSIFRVSR